MVTVLALACSAGVFGVMIRWEFFDITTQSEYDFMRNAFLISSGLLWLMVIRLELTSKSKAESLYAIQMKEYEIMRTQWLEIASEKMVYDAKKATQPLEIVQNREPIIVQVPEKEKKSKDK
tara:strand:- start:2288 stop:2650 length:363 start_codon:yes stop_codon:yes gene_type:complete